MIVQGRIDNQDLTPGALLTAIDVASVRFFCLRFQ